MLILVILGAVSGLKTIHSVLVCARPSIERRREQFRVDTIGKYLSKTNMIDTKSVSHIRGVFARTPYITTNPVLTGSHTHPHAAADRNSAANYVECLAQSVGKKMFVIQQSASDQRRRGTDDGNCAWRWGSDVLAKPTTGNPDKDNLVFIGDTDQYMDMEYQLSKYAYPTILYTYTPEAVADPGGKGADGEFAFTFDADNQMIMHINGGSKFEHHIWNWMKDKVAVSKYFGPFKVAHTIYNIDRRKTIAHRSMVLLTPFGHWEGLLKPFLASNALDTTPLTRLEPVDKDTGFLRMKFMTTDGYKVSTGVVDEYYSATVSVGEDQILALTASGMKAKIDKSTTMSHLAKGTDSKTAVVLAAFHRVNQERKDPETAAEGASQPVGPKVYTFRGNYTGEDSERQPAVKAFMNPIYNPAGVPVISKTMEEAAISKRILRIQDKVGKMDLKVDSFLHTVMTEFLNFIIPEYDAHTGHPVDIDEIFLRQPRPTQQACMEKAGYIGPNINETFNTFIKKEATGAPGKRADARVITTQANAPDSKRRGAQWMYAFSDYIKEKWGNTWYAFGRSPLDIARRVAATCIDADWGCATDFSRYDGHVNDLIREFEMRIAMRYFDTRYSVDLREDMEKQFGRTGYSIFGCKFDSGVSRASGVPETAIYNSIINVFIAYLTFRRTKVNGIYMTPDEAWDLILRHVIVGGDDGWATGKGNVLKDPTIYEKSAAMMGLTATIEVIPTGSDGVTFLSRIYSNTVWYGSPNSMCDPVRQFSKFHLTANLHFNVTPDQKYKEKILSFYCTDKNTPLIGALIERSMFLWQQNDEIKLDDDTLYDDPLGIRSWAVATKAFHDDPASVQYPNENVDNWMDPLVTAALGTYDFIGFHKYVAEVIDPHDFLNMPQFFGDVDDPPNDDYIYINGWQNQEMDPEALLAWETANKDIINYEEHRLKLEAIQKTKKITKAKVARQEEYGELAKIKGQITDLKKRKRAPVINDDIAELTKRLRDLKRIVSKRDTKVDPSKATQGTKPAKQPDRSLEAKLKHARKTSKVRRKTKARKEKA